ncbi:Hypothetical predicted protein [Lecanosticta acicola]|uniref:Uncharacterized protein n=1 Tax=Lecanosticta acicola TaxID=111012 RepID=A0AAI9EC56_9PEZI|nr:Hypothetical predicted protein [Lecanosticta acicola]
MAGRRAANPDDSPPKRTSSYFPITTTLLTFLYNILLALASATYLPHDPLYIGLSTSLYAWAGTILSVCGLAGIVLKRPTLITSFSHFLLIDTLLSTLSRFLLLHFLLEAFTDANHLCYAPTPSSSASHQPIIWNPENSRHDIVTSVKWHRENLWGMQEESANRRRCEMALGAVQLVLVGLWIAMTVAQGALAVSMRRFGKEMEMEQKKKLLTRRWDGKTKKWRRSPHPDPEKEAMMQGL